MRRITALLALVLVETVQIASAEVAFRPMSGDEIRTILIDARVDYTGKEQGAWQEFRADGRTRYMAGGESWGTWFVQGAQYCSTWGASPIASCYDMARAGNRVRFVGARGDSYEGLVK